MNSQKDIHRIKKLVLTSLFIALALIIRNFSFMVYFGGVGGMRIGFSGVFTKIPALLFGPLFGGMASGLLDILGYMLKPEGGYIPLLTVTAVLDGVLTGFLWHSLKDRDETSIRKALLTVFIAIGIIGIINHGSFLFLPNSPYTKFILKIGKYKFFASIGLIAICLLGLGLLVVDNIVKRKDPNDRVYNNFLKVFIAIGIPGAIATTLNTYILQLFIPALGKMSFMIFWIPRLIQEVLMSVILAYIISFLLSIYMRITQM